MNNADFFSLALGFAVVVPLAVISWPIANWQEKRRMRRIEQGKI